MKTTDWEPFILLPATFALLLGFATLGQLDERREQPVTQALEARLGLTKACLPVASLPGQKERRWSCDQ